MTRSGKPAQNEKLYAYLEVQKVKERRMIDADELLKLAKKTQRKLYAEDYDEILSYEDVVRLVDVLAGSEEEQP